MAIRLDKPWLPLDAETLKRVGGQLGVFELADASGTVTYIGAATAQCLFGFKGELTARIGQASHYRLEVTSAYSTRRRELLMLHYADHGCYPALNTSLETERLGRLSPGGNA